jgi:hypothetical protein
MSRINISAEPATPPEQGVKVHVRKGAEMSDKQVFEGYWTEYGDWEDHELYILPAPAKGSMFKEGPSAGVMKNDQDDRYNLSDLLRHLLNKKVRITIEEI